MARNTQLKMHIVTIPKRGKYIRDIRSRAIKKCRAEHANELIRHEAVKPAYDAQELKKMMN